VYLERISSLHSEHENELVEYCIIMDQRYYGLRSQDIKSRLFSWQKEILRNVHLSKKNQQLGRNRFLKSYPVLSMRDSEGFSVTRVKGFTSNTVARFVDLYVSELRKVNLLAPELFF